MYPIGHLAVALLLSVPFVLALRPRVGTRFTVLVLVASTIPDLDLFLPITHHHGFTHTLGFGLALGFAGFLAFVGASALVSAVSSGPAVAFRRTFVFYSFALALGAFGHVLADSVMLLPSTQPVSPLWPVSNAAMRVETFHYGNTARNLGAFVVGLGVHAVAVGSSVGQSGVRRFASPGADEED